MFFVVRRATVLIPSGPDRDPDLKHLFVNMTDPIGSQLTLGVPVNSVRPDAFAVQPLPCHRQRPPDRVVGPNHLGNSAAICFGRI